MVKKPQKNKAATFPNYIHNLVADLAWLFGVKHFDLTLGRGEKDKGNVAAEIEREEDYQRIHITLYPLFFRESRKEQRKYLLHEFCHTVTDSIHEVAERLRGGHVETPEHIRIANEKAVSQMANMLDSLLQGNSRYARIAYKSYLDPKKR